MEYSLDKYKFIDHDGVDKNGQKVHEVIALSTYAGKAVKGVAKCATNDTFDLQKGKELAAARCNEKVSAKRVKRAEKKLVEATEALKKAQAHYDKMVVYYNDAYNAHSGATVDLNYLLKQM